MDVTQEFSADVLASADLLNKLKPMIGNELLVRPEDGKIVTNPIKSVGVDAPWIYVRQHPELNCNYWHKILFDMMGIMPKNCMSCWKVVVKPRTVKELFQLYVLEEEHYDKPCKCGIEMRANVFGNYGGYFYNTSQEEGEDTLARVRKLVSEMISPEVPVYLKRFCTEYEMKFGASNKVEYTKEMEQWEKIANRWIEFPHRVIEMPPLIKIHVMRKWLHFAWDRGDPTVKEFNHGEPLYVPAVTYEREKNEKPVRDEVLLRGETVGTR